MELCHVLLLYAVALSGVFSDILGVTLKARSSAAIIFRFFFCVTSLLPHFKWDISNGSG